VTIGGFREKKVTDKPDIRAMPLYTHVDRIERGLASQGIRADEKLRPEQLFGLDQWHYHGVEAIEAAARLLRLGPQSRVLDVGAGVGGPARLLAHTTGCHVTAVELQRELHEVGLDLTRRCGLVDRVTHLCGDALGVALPSQSFDYAISFLAVLHFADRPGLFRRLADLLAPGGQIYIEDLSQRAPFSERDRQDLRTVVYGLTVTPIDGYLRDLAEAGFDEIVATDLTPDWAPFARERLAAWRGNRDAYAAAHGQGAYAAQEHFYAVIARLYEGGSLGGVRLTARKS
jgi:cyclopropane fatty-acyl-phospholipid synthase-like methyltransferase